MKTHAAPQPTRPSPRRISLAQVSGQSGRMLHRGRSEELEDQAAPTVADLAECVLFSPGDGRVWLNDQRMLLFQAATFGRLRTEMLNLLGHERTQAVFTRVGYAQGARDAQLIRSQWPDEDLTHALAAGPRLHTLEGFVKAQTVRFEYDVERGHYYGEFLWHDSVEADEHLALHGMSDRPVCWLQTAYPTGYTSWLFGKLVEFRETECRAMGAKQCRVVGQPADLWPPLEAPAGRRVRPRAAPRSDGLGAQLPPQDAAKGSEVVGVSARFTTARLLLEKVARTRTTALLVGETGVGKELFARTLHALSPRHDRPFVAINCAAIPETLMEAELFGVERGAYTGAVTARAGRFERADGGTLFLDEVASLSLVSQGKLLRALQEHEIERVGGSHVIKVDVRIVAATNVDLRQEVAAGNFREDLYFRLNVFPIELPPLRERRDDIPLLMDHFLRSFSREHGIAHVGFTRRAIEALLSYDYPGNVREMQNLIERGVVFAEPDAMIDVTHMFRHGEQPAVQGLQLGQSGRLNRSAPASTGSSAAVAPQTFAQVEHRLYEDALRRAEGNISAAARALGLSRATLDYRLNKLGLRSRRAGF